MEKEEMRATTNDDRSRKSQDPMRCAKAAMLLMSLATCREEQEKETMEQIIQDLQADLVKERIRRKNLKLCSFMELVLEIILLFSVCTTFLVFAFKSY